MKNSKIYILLLSAMGILMFSGLAKAANMTMSTYYPSISGSYNKLRLYPRTSDLTGSCTTGSLYVNSTNVLQYCQNSIWGPIPDYWTQNGDNIYLTNSITNTNLHVGIGTKTPEFRLTLINDGGIIAKGTFGSGLVLPTLPSGSGNSRFIWYPRKAAFRAGNVDGVQWHDTNIGDYSAALGKNSTANGIYSVVGGGAENTASGQYSTVIGGQNNIASGNYSAIIGGKSNAASANYTTTTGGFSNTASANYATVLGGQSNQATAIYTTVSGGSTNIVSTPYSNINGGKNNTIDPTYDVTGYSSIGGGLNNKTYQSYSVISGGLDNLILAGFIGSTYSSIGGGKNNKIGF